MEKSILEKTYQLKDGQIKLLHCKRQYILELKKILNGIRLFLALSVVFVLVCFVTWMIYKKCIIELKLEQTISLGAVFATLGSALVAVLSLVCNEQYEQFMDNVRILETSLFKKEKWERWPFVKRIQKIKISSGEYYYYILYNPSIIFISEQWKLEVSLPSGKNDFRELPIYRTLFRLITNKKKYNLMLLNQNEMQDKLIWECLTRIYVNILIYQFSKMIVWIGSCFIFSSIFFSFFYISFVNFIK